MTLTTKFESICVFAVFTGRRTSDYVHRVTPLRFKRSSGESYRVRKILRVHRDQKGRKVLVCFVVETDNGHTFGIIYEPISSNWRLVIEVEQPVALQRSFFEQM